MSILDKIKNLFYKNKFKISDKDKLDEYQCYCMELTNKYYHQLDEQNYLFVDEWLKAEGLPSFIVNTYLSDKLSYNENERMKILFSKMRSKVNN